MLDINAFHLYLLCDVGILSLHFSLCGPRVTACIGVSDKHAAWKTPQPWYICTYIIASIAVLLLLLLHTWKCTYASIGTVILNIHFSQCRYSYIVFHVCISSSGQSPQVRSFSSSWLGWLPLYDHQPSSQRNWIPYTWRMTTCAICAAWKLHGSL